VKLQKYVIYVSDLERLHSTGLIHSGKAKVGPGDSQGHHLGDGTLLI